MFPDAGVEILPEKGTLAFWYNLHLNGSGNTKTIHAACPVMLGTKWGEHTISIYSTGLSIN